MTDIKETTETGKNVEDIARSRGWVPEGEFKGDGWVPAEQYVERGYGRANELEKRLEEANQRLKAVDEHFQRTLENQQVEYEAKIAELKERRAKAVEEGDVDTFKKLDKQIDDTAAPKSKSNVERWRKQNPWFGDNPRMTIEANNALGFFSDKYGVDTDEMLEALTEHIKQLFPDHFANPNRNRETVNEGGSTKTTRKSNGYSSLSTEEKQFCDLAVDSKLIKVKGMKDMASEEYRDAARAEWTRQYLANNERKRAKRGL